MQVLRDSWTSTRTRFALEEYRVELSSINYEQQIEMTARRMAYKEVGK